MNNYRDYNYLNNNYNIPNYNQLDFKTYEPYEGFIRGNMYPSLYNTYKVTTPIKIVPQNEQAEMLTTIDSLEFAMNDIGLYLDIYPDNKEALEKFNKYRYDLNQYSYEYQKKFGPICINNDALNKYPYAWIKSPWPWESEK
ncbi:MAG: spore coat protein CotJB [Bacilli bacterium]